MTGIPHYFEVDFITAYERAARSDPDTMVQAASLLRGIAAAEPVDADAWCASVGLPPRGFAGRGLQKNPEGEPQIRAAIESGTITMPLWGLSLDPTIAASYGARFRFELEGVFPGIAAWAHSDEKHHEQEIIAGGSYDVLGTAQDGATTVVRLKHASLVGADVGTDPVLLAVLAGLEAAAEVTRSKVLRAQGLESLTVTLDDARVLRLLRRATEADLTLTVDGGKRISLRVVPDADEITARIADLLA